MRARGQSQRGSTLLVVMIFLLLFIVMAASSFRGSMTSAKTIGNMQWRNEAITAANDAIDRLLSTADFATNTATTTAAVNAAPFQVDVNGDGVNDIAVNLPVVRPDGSGMPKGTAEDPLTGLRAGPRCRRATPIPSAALNPTLPADVGCFGSGSAGSSGLGVATGASGAGTGTVLQSPSLCSNTEWSITVRATDAVTNTTVDVVQGVGVRVPTTAIPVCN